jgi:hypothetical protein
MIQLIGSLSLWIGLSTGLLNLLDFVLRDKQKKKLASIADILWIWLDEQRSAKVVQKFWSKTFQRWLVIISFLVVISVMIFVMAFFGVLVILDEVQSDIHTVLTEVDDGWYMLLPVALIISLVVSTRYTHPYIMNRLKIPVTIGGYLQKTFLGMCLSITIFFVASILLLIPLLTIEDAPNWMIVSYFFLFAIVGAVAGSEPFLFLSMIFLCLIWILIVCVITFLFRIVQFVVLRISENPKGVIAAISGLLTTIGGIIKGVFA